MARSIETIHNEILFGVSSNPDLSDLNSSSKFAIYRLFAYVVASAIYILELIFDQHKTEIEDIIANQKSGRPQWYRYMALKFQYGFDLITDTDAFDNTTANEAQIEASKIIKYAAVNEATSESRLTIKIAGETGGVLAPIGTLELEAFEAYINEIKYAGVKHSIINVLPDKLFLNIEIQRDALVLDSTGTSIINGNKPVNDAIEAYIKQLPFDGEFNIFDFLKYISINAQGVKTARAINIEISAINPDKSTYADPVSVFVKTIPYSGYFVVDNYNSISYVV